MLRWYASIDNDSEGKSLKQFIRDNFDVPSSPDWVNALEESAASIRKDIAGTLFRTGGGHYGGSFSVVEILLTLYARHLRITSANVRQSRRDRFVLSKGHSAVALYAVLRHLGIIDVELDSYASFGSPLEGHPDMTAMPAIDWSTGSLGQGLSAALGMAIGLRDSDRQVWVVLGDGECQEGQVWEAAMLAGLAGPRNLRAIVDVNRHQEFGWRVPGRDLERVDPVPDMAEKWSAFGWDVIQCDGHDFAAVDRAFRDAGGTDRPVVILAATRKGFGTTVTESDPLRFHCTEVSNDEHQIIIAELDRR